MGLNAAIDVAISLILMYLVLSLIVTVVNEALATGADLRASNLRDAINSLIDSDTLKNDFYNNGLINSVNAAVDSDASRVANGLSALCRWLIRAPDIKGPHVSYLSGQTFSQALLASVDITKDMPTYADIKAAVETLPDTDIRDALLAHLTLADGDLQKLRNNVAAWFDSAMDRVSGVYKRHLKQISFIVGAVVVLMANADTVTVTRALWHDPALRAGMVEAANKLIANPPQLSGSGADTANPRPAAATSGANANPPPSSDTAASVGQSTAGNPVDLTLSKLKTDEDTLRPLPLGWSFDFSTLPNGPEPLAAFLAAKFLGLVLTAVAVSLGAPFWFDLLSMFMHIRGAGDKPKKKKATGTT